MPSVEEGAHARPGSVFDLSLDHGATPHERVVFGYDPSTGLRAIIAIHSTVLGPALGGTRFYPYEHETDALSDVLRLSRGMTYKAAAAGLDLGGGKAVIIGDPAQHKSPELLRAYGRLVESLHGAYVTAGDVGTTSEDMDVIGGMSRHVVARTEAHGGSGDSAPLTALGVFHAMRAAAELVWSTPSLHGRRIGVEGAGKVGLQLVALLVEEGARVVVADVDPRAVERIRREWPEVVATDNVMEADLDIYAPCALGATLTAETADMIRAQVVCGAANNQLATADVEDRLHQRAVVWVPDYLANAGGLIQVAGELKRKAPPLVRHEVEGTFDTVGELLLLARELGLTPGQTADHVAEKRLRAASPAAEPFLAGRNSLTSTASRP